MQKIMIVEDDEFLREELENIYHKAGYEVCCVTDFPETGAVCEAEHRDLLVLDLGLPGISGFALCKEIRKKGSLPILVLTSRDKMQDELKALELGADEYLTKPCHKDRLLARTENLLKRAMGNAHLLDGDDFLFDTRTYTVCQGKDACHIPENQGKIAFFGGVQNCRFKGMVFPGDKLKLETKIIKRKGPVGVGEAVASVNGNVVASAQLTFMVGE